jgi:hypothetical protein
MQYAYNKKQTKDTINTKFTDLQIYRAYTKESCGFKSDTVDTAPFFSVCPV